MQICKNLLFFVTIAIRESTFEQVLLAYHSCEHEAPTLTHEFAFKSRCRNVLEHEVHHHDDTTTATTRFSNSKRAERLASKAPRRAKSGQQRRAPPCEDEAREVTFPVEHKAQARASKTTATTCPRTRPSAPRASGSGKAKRHHSEECLQRAEGKLLAGLRGDASKPWPQLSATKQRPPEGGC